MLNSKYDISKMVVSGQGLLNVVDILYSKGGGGVLSRRGKDGFSSES